MEAHAAVIRHCHVALGVRENAAVSQHRVLALESEKRHLGPIPTPPLDLLGRLLAQLRSRNLLLPIGSRRDLAGSPSGIHGRTIASCLFRFVLPAVLSQCDVHSRSRTPAHHRATAWLSVRLEFALRDSLPDSVVHLLHAH